MKKRVNQSNRYRASHNPLSSPVTSSQVTVPISKELVSSDSDDDMYLPSRRTLQFSSSTTTLRRTPDSSQIAVADEQNDGVADEQTDGVAEENDGVDEENDGVADDIQNVAGLFEHNVFGEDGSGDEDMATKFARKLQTHSFQPRHSLQFSLQLYFYFLTCVLSIIL